MEIRGSKKEVKWTIWSMFKEMYGEEDAMGCAPACRLYEDDENYYNCDFCYKEDLKRNKYFDEIGRKLELDDFINKLNIDNEWYE